nr:Gag-Pol polyprotein [Tanacetum cinerariifolium]
MHTFYQRYPSEKRWTKDHPLEKVIGNPSQSVRTRRQLESDAEMCMFALTVSRTEPKNIKEAMADSAWIESMQEELYQFYRLDVWELVDKPLCTNVINLKWLWKNKCDEENTVIRNKSRVIPTTSVSRPQLKSNPKGDRVLHSNSHGKKLEVEEHRRSVKKTVASDSIKKPRNNVRKLNECFCKISKWTYIKFTPLGYMWKPKSKQANVNPNVSMPLANASRTTNVKDTMSSRRSTVSNTPLSSNSFAAHRDCPIHR